MTDKKYNFMIFMALNVLIYNEPGQIPGFCRYSESYMNSTKKQRTPQMNE
jgi:hypothetical protein